ncbi:hypothetical protein ACP70R_002749 [Stipagrostis hirtigluma subsp. patula]
MAVPPRAMPEHHRKEQEDGGDDEEFTFPTPPPERLLVRDKDGRRAFRLPCPPSPCSSPPAWLLSSPIRRSFSAADCAASPWRAKISLSRHRLTGACSPALSDYSAGAGGFCDEVDDEEDEEEERMDSLWEDLNDADAAARLGGDPFLGPLDVPRRRSVAGPDAAERARRAAKERRDAAAAAVLGASRSSRRRPPGLVVMMRALKRMFVAHKGKSKVHKDEQSTASASSPSSCTNHSKKR